MSTHSSSDLYDTFFRISMWWRIFYGFLRLIFGLAVLHVVGQPFSGVLYDLVGEEVTEDPHDILVHAFHVLVAHGSFTITYFIAIYLIFWGLIDIFLPINLLREKMWAFYASYVFIGLFVCYELYRLAHTHSQALAIATAIDIIMLWLIRHEHKKLQSKLSSRNM